MPRSSFLGVAGEHYVMSQLLREDFIAALAPVGVPIADILITDKEGRGVCAVQVKTRSESGVMDWPMSAKHEDIHSDSLFYVFLSFPIDRRLLPDLYVLPSRIVAYVLRQSHQNWLSDLGGKGRTRTDGPMRRFKADYSSNGMAEEYGPDWLESYRDNWSQLRPQVAHGSLA